VKLILLLYCGYVSISRTLQLDGGAGKLTASSYPFSNLTLLSWDFSITNHEAGQAQSAGIAISYRVRPSQFCISYT